MQTATSGFTNVEQFNISSACFCWLALVIYLLCAYYYLVNTMLHGIQVIVIVLCPFFLISYIPSAKLNFFDGIRIYAAHLLGWVCVCAAAGDVLSSDNFMYLERRDNNALQLIFTSFAF